LQSHYRKTLIYSLESLDSATNAYNKLKNKIKNIKENPEGNIDQKTITQYQNKFKEAFENDMNTSSMLTTLYDVIKDDTNNNTKLYLIEDFDKVLSLNLLKEEKISKQLEDYIKEKLEARNKAKEAKNYQLADEIRDELLTQNIIIKDTKEGTKFEIRK
jgi:cysteinyl-tRNA synthetase